MFRAEKLTLKAIMPQYSTSTKEISQPNFNPALSRSKPVELLEVLLHRVTSFLLTSLVSALLRGRDAGESISEMPSDLETIKVTHFACRSVL